MAYRGEVRATRTVSLWIASIAVAWSAGPASAVDFFDGRIQVHGYVEQQIRSIAADFDPNDGWDLSQFYNVIGVETDLNVFPNGIGPFDLVSGFVRLEGRFDCIWYQCGGVQGINAWGDDAKKFPSRNTGARKSPFTGTVSTGDRRRIHSIPVDQLSFAYKDEPVIGNNRPAYLWHVPGVDTLFGVKDPLQTPSTNDDPAFYVFERFVRPGEEYRFALRQAKGQPDGHSLQVLGPFFPQNRIVPHGALADRANPFNPLDENPVLIPAFEAGVASSAFGSAALPYRPSPLIPAGKSSITGDSSEPRGLFIPNEAVRKLIQNDKFGDFDQNFTQTELSWNKGASQTPERELKEAYIDLEAFDSRLWIRAGRQNIVWGKTELFRTTDQFNPQDLALATLASLEESRIALWALRGVWSFYTVGPFEDMRLELAANIDEMEPTDLGRCGEPYTPNPVCDKTAALFAHGVAGSTLAGEIRPPDPWDDTEGLEFGARLEFRWDRYSFALSDFYGYDDFPYVDPVFYYTRNVDPRTGRPRRAQSQAGCDPEGRFDGDTSGCLGPGEDALYHHHANQQRFALICASSIGFNSLDYASCAQSVFNSSVTQAGLPIPTILGFVFSGSQIGALTVRNQFIPGLISLPARTAVPIVDLNIDANDGPGTTPSLSSHLTNEQEALLGCGPFWQTNCDSAVPGESGGIDLLNAELSVLIQSWPGFPGTTGQWLTNAGPSGPPQPGTMPYFGGPVATRYENGNDYVLPGARGPLDDDWNANQDGCVRAGDPGCAGAHDLLHPYSGALFQNELAAFSWNYMITLIAFSQDGAKPEVPCAAGQDTSTCRKIDELVASPTYYLRPDGCSYAAPQYCSNIQAIYSIAHTTRRDVKAGGNGDFGRTDFDWHQGGVGVLRYEKRNVLGLSMDFAEDMTKSNWGIESTWIEGNQFEDNDQIDRLTRADTFNLTVSVDRPTFINFLNEGRTFFFNSQWFFQWIEGYEDSFTQNGPWNVLATFHVDTGYFRDRLLPGITFVWDFQSQSGAILPEIAYRFTENFSATLTAGIFSGRWQPNEPPIKAISDFPYRAGRRQGSDWTEQGISPVRDNDEVAIRIRYTF